MNEQAEAQAVREVDMSLFTEYELREDMAASEMDATSCEKLNRIRFAERISINRAIVAKIKEELIRRGLYA